MSAHTEAPSIAAGLVQMSRSTSVDGLVRATVQAVEAVGGEAVAWVSPGPVAQTAPPALVQTVRDSMARGAADGWTAWPVFSPEGEVAVLVARGSLPHSVDLVAEQATALWTSLGTFTTLEAMVADEMMRVVQREESIQLILDSMSGGLVLCTPDGQIGEIRSAPALAWFGEPGEDQRIWDYLAGGDGHLSDLIEVGWDQLGCGWLPFDVAAGQLPSRLPPRDGRTYGLDFTPVHEGGELSGVVVGITDETALVEAERAEVAGRELVSVMRHLVKDPGVLAAGIEDLARLCSGLLNGDDERLTRDLHTIKGNAAVLGLGTLSHAAHTAEDHLIDGADRTSVAAFMEQAWLQTKASLQPVLGQADGMQISPAALELVEQLARQGRHDEVLAQVSSWRNSSLASLFRLLTSRVQELAERDDKRVQIVIDDAGLHLPHKEMEPFVRSLAHVVRNALAHGIETTAVRESAGKPPQATIRLSARRTRQHLILDVSDDGAGVDFEAVGAKAKALGLPMHTPEQRMIALCTSGLSRRDTVDEESGRGVGMAAVHAEAINLGGSVSLTTESGRGTTWRFELPL